MMPEFRKIEFDKSLLGADVTVITNKSAVQRGFEVKKAYKGKLKEKVDWMVGCPIFECDIGKLGLGYECYLVEKVNN